MDKVLESHGLLKLVLKTFFNKFKKNIFHVLKLYFIDPFIKVSLLFNFRVSSSKKGKFLQNYAQHVEWPLFSVLPEDIGVRS